jgi:hypothetical protein
MQYLHTRPEIPSDTTAPLPTSKVSRNHIRDKLIGRKIISVGQYIPQRCIPREAFPRTRLRVLSFSPFSARTSGTLDFVYSPGISDTFERRCSARSANG